jgi:pimeloyl-ACP methyl ester carboxylesterase
VDSYVTVDDMLVRYRRIGRGAPMVLLHGLGASLEVWNPLVDAVAGRFTTYALDLPGFGLSAPPRFAMTPDAAALFVHRFLDAAVEGRPIIVGSSMGGAVAAVAAGLHPERCAALVLAAPGGFEAEISRELRWMALPVFGELAVWLTRRNPVRGIVNAFADPDRIPDWLVACVARDFARADVRSSVLGVLRATAGVRGLRPDVVEAVRAAAARVRCPTLAVWGTADRVIPATQAESVARAIAGARVHRIQGVGHVPFIESAAEFARSVLAFLDTGVPAGVPS